MPRFKICIEYQGTNLAGWQRQKNSPTVQEIIEKAIFAFAHEEVVLYGAGRTDAGVHALGQIAHFDLIKDYDPYKIIVALNHFLRPNIIGIKECIKVNENFHARFDAKARHYKYIILNRCSKPILDQDRVWWIREILNIQEMQKGAQYLIGTHDFTSFRAKHCQANSPIKTVTKIEIIRKGEFIKVYFSAPSFLHHMVRNIVGTLVNIGKGRYEAEKIKSILADKNRSKAGITAPACGLYFIQVDY